MLEQFQTSGYYGPVEVLTTRQRQRIMKAGANIRPELAEAWNKGLAVNSVEIFNVAISPSILDIVRELIGDDVLLWGAYFVNRRPGQAHPWHNDIESSVDKGKTVSVWIGLKNTTRDSGLSVIAGSHRFRKSIQEVAHHRNGGSHEMAPEELTLIASELDARSELVNPDIHDGQAIFFDGWIWHGSHNRTNSKRTALLLQFATPDAEIRIPDPNDHGWPFKFLQQPKPPCIMVSGRDEHHVNKIVPPPVGGGDKQHVSLSSQVYKLDVPLQTDEQTGWRPYKIFKGASPNLQGISCHASSLAPGQCPHPPHHHKEDEILIMLHGEAELELPDLASVDQDTKVTLRPGEFVFYPAWFFHTLTTTSETPANYLMFKWHNEAFDKGEGLQYGKYRIDDHFKEKPGKPYSTNRLFEEQTATLKMLQCHTTVMPPGVSYPAHIDAHDVAILILEGEVETMGSKAGPNTVIFYPGGHMHDMHNPNEVTARYLVFEFHGKHSRIVKRKKRTIWHKALSKRAWKEKLGI